MADTEISSDDEVRILPPDQSLARKIGPIDLDKVFSAEAVQTAQQAIVQAGATLMEETKAAIAELKTLAAALAGNPQKTPGILSQLIQRSFFIKTRTATSGYNLVAEIAKSLEIFCEARKKENLTPRDCAIINWHVKSIDMLLEQDIKSDGGAVGQTIMAELKQLMPPLAAQAV